MDNNSKVAVITGGNAGIGLTVAERLLTEHPGLRLCLACRNKTRAQAALDALQLSHPTAQISIVIVDTSNIKSVYNAVTEIKKMYSHIDYLYLNAGIMQVVGVDWNYFWKTLFTKNFIHMFTTGDGLLKEQEEITEENLEKVFTTNVFGHFVLIKELESVLINGTRPSQIIWTSSSNAQKHHFSLENIQHRNERGGHYSSSKYSTDLLSLALNERLNNKGVYSHVTCPGLVMTNLTFGILPSWFWNLILPIFWLLRIFVPTMNYDTYNGSEALVWLSKQKPESLDPMCKYVSHCNFIGKRYVHQHKLKIDQEDANQLYNQLNTLENKFHQKYKS
ncbi:3-keto-steroid reductase/17-beta-hydroxysteroid dehydrogenase 7 isoform X2 [Patella vulgata]|uniref:3-keto-steroid reductase/17-beta-hydroxysteroid dehydrogenase 7 isoform X2 n=1 Tax=Patella vulgata TaxID=6465 RepID=UPI00218082CF|nr:3-keto-steroid reductase/17-beta-hydroxysteroid dehydrogenase 7 isoform X2 [Patella vulgata]